uniref:hypothetical protein n=1 Tax=Moorena producens TaxID=1155739 RepID=UPI00192AD292
MHDEDAFYVHEAHVPIGPDEAVSVADDAPYPLSQTFRLHSHPEALHTLYLDFDGHETQDPTWNSGQPFETPAFDLDGSPESFSDAELVRMQRIWQRVAEDFIPFGINVSTEEPPLADLIRDWSDPTDLKWGNRVVIGGRSSDWYGESVAGVAQRSFNRARDSPVFVFEANLNNGNEKQTAEVISHEAGHAMGLFHDGVNNKPIYNGHGGGETGWAPIMGIGYYKELTQW